jgi:hypothetical protein
MRTVETSERSMPEINPTKVCFVVEKSRELLSEDEGVAPDASNPTDDDVRRVLTDAAYAPIHQELVQFIEGLDVDEAAALVALAWIGRGDFEPEDWRSAVLQAGERREGPTWKYLLGMPLLPDYLEEALSNYGHSCGDFGSDASGEGV